MDLEEQRKLKKEANVPEEFMGDEWYIPAKDEHPHGGIYVWVDSSTGYARPNYMPEDSEN
jgi:hypothetical protein